MTQVKKEITVLQTANTIKLGVYCLLQCAELTNNNYVLRWNNASNIQLFEIAEKNKEKKILSMMQVGGSRLKNIKDDSNTNMLQFKTENETEIMKKMNNYYLNPKHCSKWNEMIGDFYGANFYAFDNINYLMPTKLKLKKWVSSRDILVKYITESRITNNINQLAAHIKNVKGCIRKWFLKLQNIPFFTTENKKKQTVEHLILEHEYNAALNILCTNDDKNDRYYPYYKHIYSIICYQQLYKQENDIQEKKRYFLKMIELLEKITRFMVPSDPLTCSLFADILLNYNPNNLTSNDWIFITNMVVSGCCFMCSYNDIDIYNICGSIHSYLFLLYLIENHKLTATVEIKRVILKNMDELFCAYDENINIQRMSEWYELVMVRHKTLWKVKKQKILECEGINILREENDLNEMKIQDNILICDECGKGPFEDVRALRGHKREHNKSQHKLNSLIKDPEYRKRKDKEAETKRQDNINIKKVSEINDKKEKEKGKENRYECLYCDMQSQYKTSVKRHILTRHKDLLKLDSNVVEPINCSTLTDKRNKNNNTNNRSRVTTIIGKDEADETAKKKQKQEYDVENIDSLNNRKCNECGKVCKTKSGLGTHKYHCHGITAKGKNNKKNKKNKKNKHHKHHKNNKSMKNKEFGIVKHEKNIITISDDSESDNDIDMLTNNNNKNIKHTNVYKRCPTSSKSREHKKAIGYDLKKYSVKKCKSNKNNKNNKNNKKNKCVNVITIIDESSDSDDDFILKLS